MVYAIIFSVITIAIFVIGMAVEARNNKKDPKITFLVDKEGNFRGYKLPDVVDNPDLKKINEP